MILCSTALIGYALFSLVRGRGAFSVSDKAARKASYDSLLAAAETAIPGQPVGDALPLGNGRSDLTEAAVIAAGEDETYSMLGTLTFSQRGVTMPVGDVTEDKSVLPRLRERTAMVIEGTQDDWQFGILDDVGMGEEVVFTDVFGHKYYYETTNVQRLDADQQGTEDWYLKTDAAFPYHRRDPQFADEAFYAAYPMAVDPISP